MIRKLSRHYVELTRLLKWLGPVQGGRTYAAHVRSGRFPRAEPQLRQIQIKGVPHPVYYRVGTSDWPVLEQVFERKEYDIVSGAHAAALDRLYKRLISSSKRPLIIDCGANIGLASIWYATRFPEALIYAIEPEPGNFSLLEKNCSFFKNIVPVKAGVSDTETMISLANNSDEPWAWRTVEDEGGTVPTVTISDLIARGENTDLFIVKIDIEGFEVELFRSNVDWTRQAPLIVYESHDWLCQWKGTAHAVMSILCKDKRDYIQNGENTFAFSHSLLN